MRWGILSTARIAGALIASGSDEQFVAVASRDRARAETFARQHGIARAHGSYEALLADPEVEAVYIPLPNSLHVDWSIRALQAGKHVLCEKPMSRDPEAVERAFDVAEREGRLLAEAFMWRHHPQLAEAQKLLAEGAIGELRLIRSVFAYTARDVQNIRLQAALEGGGLMDTGCYCISGCRALAGAEPERVCAEQVVGGDGVDVALTATLRFPGDVLAHFDCGISYAGGRYLEAVGVDGALRLPDPWIGREAAIEIRLGRGTPERIEVAQADPYALELANFADAVAGRCPPLIGRDDAIAQARTIAALYASVESKLPYSV